MKLIDLLKGKEQRKKIFFLCSLLTTLGFAVYNGIAGIIYSLSWNISIAIYYVFLFLLRISTCLKSNNKVLNNIISFFFLLLNLSLVVPISLLALHKKIVKMDMILSIAIATYTTYKVTKAIMNILSKKKSKRLEDKEKFTLNLIDALVSVLNLQNTLITVNGDSSKDMLNLSIISSFIIYILIIIITLIFIKYKRKIINSKSV